MLPRNHLALSTAAGGVVWASTGEPWTLPVTVAVGVGLDIDHAPDMWWAFALGRPPVATLALHAWEWLAGLTALGIESGFPWWLSAILVGLGLHLVTDHLFNKGGPWTYFLAYRALHRFQVNRLAPQWDFDHAYEVLKKEVPPAVRLIEWWKARKVRSGP